MQFSIISGHTVQYITLCHKKRMTSRVLTLWRIHITSLITSMLTMRFLEEMPLNLKAFF